MQSTSQVLLKHTDLPDLLSCAWSLGKVCRYVEYKIKQNIKVPFKRSFSKFAYNFRVMHVRDCLIHE